MRLYNSNEFPYYTIFGIVLRIIATQKPSTRTNIRTGGAIAARSNAFFICNPMSVHPLHPYLFSPTLLLTTWPDSIALSLAKNSLSIPQTNARGACVQRSSVALHNGESEKYYKCQCMWRPSVYSYPSVYQSRSRRTLIQNHHTPHSAIPREHHSVSCRAAEAFRVRIAITKTKATATVDDRGGRRAQRRAKPSTCCNLAQKEAPISLVTLRMR